MRNKIAIGTVQFGLDYGINNSNGKLASEQANKIFEFAFNNNIDTIDTALQYGNSESVIGELIEAYPSNWKIISKFPKVEQNQYLEDILNESLSRLRVKSIYGYLAHSSDQFFSDNSIWEELAELKSSNKIEKIGYSLNTPLELEKLLSLSLVPDLIQVPCNLFDQRFVPFFQELKSKGVEIHTRSAFLQGLMFTDAISLNPYFDSVKPFIIELQEKFGENLSSILLQYCASIDFVDRVVVGNDNFSQFVNNYQSLNTKLESSDLEWIHTFIKSFNFDESTVVPMNWPKNV